MMLTSLENEKSVMTRLANACQSQLKRFSTSLEVFLNQIWTRKSETRM